MSKQSAIQLAIYPTPAPHTGEVFLEVPIFDAVEEACRYVYAAKGVLKEEQRTVIREHFEQLFELMDSHYHLELWVENELLVKEFWEELHQFFPQMAWTKSQMELKEYGRRVYRFEFIPFVLREKEFPFAVHLEDSLAQQFGLSREEALKQAEGLIQELASRSLINSFDSWKEPIDKKAVNMNEADSVKKNDEKKPVPLFDHPPKKNERKAEVKTKRKSDVPATQQNEKSFRRLQLLNKQLEMTIEKLEQSMLYSGITYFDHDAEEEVDWDKQLTISLREYTYLMQKAKFLEQVWQVNGELVNKTEKMIVNGTQLIYERNQVKKIKDNLTSQDIHFVMYECQLIESRVKVRPRPWFRKPYVKLMKMDYTNLLSKAAYFDLLQGESGVLERGLKRQRESEAVKEPKEAD